MRLTLTETIGAFECMGDTDMCMINNTRDDKVYVFNTVQVAEWLKELRRYRMAELEKVSYGERKSEDGRW